jgi:hypothetical protein
MLTATIRRAARFAACPQCDGVLIRLKLDQRRDREMLEAGGFDLSRPLFECPSCCSVGQESKPSPVERELVVLL